MKPAGKTTLTLWHLTASRESTWAGRIWIWRGFDMWYIISYLVSLTAQALLILLHLNLFPPPPPTMLGGGWLLLNLKGRSMRFFLQSRLLLSAVNCRERGSLALIRLSRGVCVCLIPVRWHDIHKTCESMIEMEVVCVRIFYQVICVLIRFRAIIIRRKQVYLTQNTTNVTSSWLQ